ncbi:hypothetical protein DSUL_40120 [Desulfovibrionales bacterium]
MIALCSKAVAAFKKKIYENYTAQSASVCLIYTIIYSLLLLPNLGGCGCTGRSP